MPGIGVVGGVRRFGMLVLPALLVALALGLAGVTPAQAAQSGSSAAAPHFPRGFVGMMADGPIFDSHVNLGHQLQRMTGVGVQRVRTLFSWAGAQPYPNWSSVPSSETSRFESGVNGVPTDFHFTDAFMTNAAEHRLPVLPVVRYSPSWDASPNGNHVPPDRPGPFGDYITTLIQRYGPQGQFWHDHPGIPRDPITAWQVWNEPDIAWGKQWPTQYVALLKVAHRDIKQADPSATTVLASLSNYSWKDLTSIYRVKGSRRLFDEVTINAYTAKPQGVITILDYNRQVMDRYGDRDKPLVATEVGWPAAKGKVSVDKGFNTTNQGQATKLRRLLPLIASNRKRLGLKGFYYYTWITTYQNDPSNPNPFFAFSGLLRYNTSKHRIYTQPVYNVFRKLVLQYEG